MSAWSIGGTPEGVGLGLWMPRVVDVHARNDAQEGDRAHANNTAEIKTKSVSKERYAELITLDTD